MVELFDKLLVLSGEGELLYFGPVDRPLLRDVFLDSASDSLAAAEDAADAEGGGDGRDKGSIADLVLAASLDKTGAAEGRIRERYRASAAARDVEGEVARLRATARRDAAELLASKEEYPNSFAYRFQLVCSRRVTLIKRNAVTWTRVLIALMFGLIIGSLFAYSPNTAVGALTKVRVQRRESFCVAYIDGVRNREQRAVYLKLAPTLSPSSCLLHLPPRTVTSSSTASSCSCSVRL